MLYKKNTTESLEKSLFENPTSEFRGTPFWALNSHLTKDELCRQIDVFKEMGLGGFHLHVRTGLENEYLSEEYMNLMKDTVVKAKSEEMLAWLYDEDRWPSGAAGGFVTKDERYRGRCLLFTPYKDAEAYSVNDSRAEGGRSGKGKLIACYDIVLDSNGNAVFNGTSYEAKGHLSMCLQLNADATECRIETNRGYNIVLKQDAESGLWYVNIEK